ncbi:WD40 repeat domain-containing serine/threonine protein kinase [Pyxidicoccus sp. 3LFB2]
MDDDTTLPRTSPASPSSVGHSTTLSPPRTSSTDGVPPGREQLHLPLVDPDRYLVGGIVAEGGHGRILRAEDRYLERTVALKEPLEPGAFAEARFLTEARLTARLQHPSIVPLYEAGRWPGGAPFYAMKLVSGRSLDGLIAEASHLDARLALLPHALAAAEAVAYAHGQRILHRDLKPANILVGELGETFVIDWGLAKELGRPEAPVAPGPEPESRRSAEHTQAGTVMGTPAYMPPEQAAGQPVDESADVYALGSILYHLLAGRPPYEGTRSRDVLTQVLGGAPVPLAQLQPAVPQELLDIVARAMAREPARRYPDARELAEDLRRFQTGKLVAAHRYSSWELAWRFVSRHRATLLVAAVALVALVGSAVMYHQRVVRAWNEAMDRADELVLVQARNTLDLRRDPDGVFQLLNSVSPRFSRWGEARVLAADAHTRTQASGRVHALRGHEGALNCVAFSADDQWLATTGDDRAVRLWNRDTGQGEKLGTYYDDEAWSCSFSPDGSLLATGSKDGTVSLWVLGPDGQGRTERKLERRDKPVSMVSFTSDGRSVLATDEQGRAWAWDVASGEGRRLGKSETLRAGPLLPGDQALVGVDEARGGVWLVDVRDQSERQLHKGKESLKLFAVASRGQRFAVAGPRHLWLFEGTDLPPRAVEPPPGVVHALALSKDGNWLGARTEKGVLLLEDLTTGTRRLLDVGPGWKGALVFSSDARWLASARRDGKVWLWDRASGRERLLESGEVSISHLAFSRDGRYLAAASHDGVARVHDVTQHSVRELQGHKGAAGTVTFAPDSRHVLSLGTEDGRVLRASLEAGASGSGDAQAEGVAVTQALADGSLLVTGNAARAEGSLPATDEAEGTVALWDGEGRLLKRLKGPVAPLRAVALSADGLQVAAADDSGGVWWWAVGSDGSDDGRKLERDGHAVRALAFSSDGRSLALGDEAGAVLLWEAGRDKARDVYLHKEAVTTLAFSADGRLLASGSGDHSVWLQPLGPGEGRRLDAGGRGVLQVAFSPDGATLLGVSDEDTTVQLWRVATGERTGRMWGHSRTVRHFAFSPEGSRLATASDDGTVRIWDQASGRGRAVLGHSGPVLHVAFSPDGRLVASTGEDGVVRVWTDDLPRDSEPLREWLRQASRP